MGIVLIVAVVAIVIVCGVAQWLALRVPPSNEVPPLFIGVGMDRGRPVPTWRVPRATTPQPSTTPPRVVVPSSPFAPPSVVARETQTPLAVVRDDAPAHEHSPLETVRFRRTADEPVQILPGRLEVLSGDPRQREIRFVRVAGQPAELILGREPGDSARHVELHSRTVSRRHARLEFDHGRWAVENLSQTNPVVLNDEELSARDGSRALTDGDRLELGDVTLRFHAR